MLVAAFNFLSPPASWQQRLCLALQVWNLLECQEWDGLTHPACPNVFLQVVCSHFSIMDKQHQHLMMAGTVEFEAALVEPQCSDHFPCVLIPHDIAEILSDSQFPNVKVDNIFLLAGRFFSLHTRSCCFLQTMEIFPVPFKAVRMLSHMVASVTAD